MMYKKALAKIGINRGVLVGILFMILVIGAIAVSVKMVRGEGSGGELYQAKDGTLHNTLEEAIQASNDDLYTPPQVPNTNGVKINGETSDLKMSGDTLTGTGPGGQQVNLQVPQGGFTSEVTYAPGQGFTGTGDTIANGGNYQATSDGYITSLDSASPMSLGGANSGVEASGCTSCGAANGAGPGGSGTGGAGEGSKTPKLDAAFSSAQQVMGVASQIGGPIKEALKTQPNAPVLFVPQDVTGEVKVDEGKAVTLVDSKGNGIVVVGKEGGTTVSWNGQALQEIKMQGGGIALYVPYGAEANTYETKNGETATRITNELAKGEPALTNTGSSTTGASSNIVKFFLPLIRLIGFVDASSSDITGEVIMGSPEQFIELKGYDIKTSGRNLNIKVLRAFDKVNAQGTDLHVVDGEMMINFKNLKTNYPRQVKSNEFFINEIRNDYDTNNVFMLVPGGAKGNYFEDARFRLTVGDAVVKNPLEGYENISIPRRRLAMWKKVIEGDIIN